jgi:hypothetical protein
MNKTLLLGLVIVGGIVLSALIFGAGLMIGGINYRETGYSSFNMMGGNGRMGGNNMMDGNNRMGGNRSDGAANSNPLSVDQAKSTVESYLKELNNSDLELKEIMIFDNNAYARITEKSSGIGAMELLVDPASLSVFPEYGPNMMWNLKYSHMSGNGMMGNRNPTSSTATTTMTVTSEQAAKIAQQYLDQQFPGYQAAADPDPFYGYYTIDILKDGNPTGMLSVNGFTGQVFLHTWHGTFIEMWE